MELKKEESMFDLNKRIYEHIDLFKTDDIPYLLENNILEAKELVKQLNSTLYEYAFINQKYGTFNVNKLIEDTSVIKKYFLVGIQTEINIYNIDNMLIHKFLERLKIRVKANKYIINVYYYEQTFWILTTSKSIANNLRRKIKKDSSLGCNIYTYFTEIIRNKKSSNDVFKSIEIIQKNLIIKRGEKKENGQI